MDAPHPEGTASLNDDEGTAQLERDAGDHANPIAREGGVAGDDDLGDGVGGGGGPSRVI